MFLSYLITTHNEEDSLDELLSLLKKYKSDDQEIVILDDFSTNKRTHEIFEKYKDIVEVHTHLLNLNYGEHKNYGKSLCKGDWIFQIDADELVSELLLKNITAILNSNDSNDLLWVPRINYFDGITDEDIIKWGWFVSSLEDLILTRTFKFNDPYYNFLKKHMIIKSTTVNDDFTHTVLFHKPIVNFPDYQGRIYKNKDCIKYERKLHEQIVGYTSHTFIDYNINPSGRLVLYHNKSIEVQRQTNQYYQTLFSMEDNKGFAIKR